MNLFTKAEFENHLLICARVMFKGIVLNDRTAFADTNQLRRLVEESGRIDTKLYLEMIIHASMVTENEERCGCIKAIKAVQDMLNALRNCIGGQVRLGETELSLASIKLLTSLRVGEQLNANKLNKAYGECVELATRLLSLSELFDNISDERYIELATTPAKDSWDVSTPFERAIWNTYQHENYTLH